MSQLLLIRHGQPLSPKGVMIGTTDPPLSPEGQAQASSLAPRLAGDRLGALLTSPLKRATQTAEIISRPLSLVPLPVPGFREIGLGLFEGLTAAEAQKKYPLQWAKRGRDIYNVAPPEGESYAQLSARVLSALDASLAPLGLDTNVAIVAHRAVIQVIMASQAGLPPEQAPTIPIQYGQLVKVKRK